MTEPYKYTGDLATRVCRNGHFTVWTIRDRCEVCDAPIHDIEILSDITRLPVSIIGYDMRGWAHFRDVDGGVTVAPEDVAVKMYVCPCVYDWPLMLSRMYAWGIVTA